MEALAKGFEVALKVMEWFTIQNGVVFKVELRNINYSMEVVVLS